MEFNDLNIRSRKCRKEIKNLIDQVIDSNRCLEGLENEKLEKNLKYFLKGRYVRTVASGHDAILLSLLFLKLTNKDEVIFPANAYPTIFPIAQSGAKPVPCDVDENGLIDPIEITKKLTQNTRVVIITHLYGLVCDIDQIKKTIAHKNIALIEDCAQAFGSKYKDKPVGTLGDIGCFSFYPTKNLGTLGDGGAVWTKNKKAYDFINMAKSYGEIKRYYSYFPSGHSRMPEIQAGILNIFLKNIKENFSKRKQLTKYYLKKINDLKLKPYIRALYPIKNSIVSPIQHLFVITAKKRNQLKKYLNKNGVKCLIHYPFPIHLTPAFKYLGYKNGQFPISEKLSKNILSLPFHQYMSKEQINHIFSAIHSFYYD